MKKMLILFSFLALSLSASVANPIDNKAATNNESPVLLIVATKDDCTVTGTCSNGNSVSCSSGGDCDACFEIVVDTLQGGLCE